MKLNVCYTIIGFNCNIWIFSIQISCEYSPHWNDTLMFTPTYVISLSVSNSQHGSIARPWDAGNLKLVLLVFLVSRIWLYLSCFSFFCLLWWLVVIIKVIIKMILKVTIVLKRLKISLHHLLLRESTNRLMHRILIDLPKKRNSKINNSIYPLSIT